MEVPGYKILRQDRNRTKSNNADNKTSGGGVALYIDVNISYKPTTPDSEAVFFYHLRNTLDQVSNTNMQTHLSGDFNCNMLNKSNLSQRMCEIADEYQLT